MQQDVNMLSLLLTIVLTAATVLVNGEILSNGPQGKFCGTVFKGQVGVDVDFVSPWEFAAKSPAGKPPGKVYRSYVDAKITVPWVLRWSGYFDDESCAAVPIYIYVADSNSEESALERSSVTASKGTMYYTPEQSECLTDAVYRQLVAVGKGIGPLESTPFQDKAKVVKNFIPRNVQQVPWDGTVASIDLAGWGSVEPC